MQGPGFELEKYDMDFIIVPMRQFDWLYPGE